MKPLSELTLKELQDKLKSDERFSIQKRSFSRGGFEVRFDCGNTDLHFIYPTIDIPEALFDEFINRVRDKANIPRIQNKNKNKGG